MFPTTTQNHETPKRFICVPRNVVPFCDASTVDPNEHNQQRAPLPPGPCNFMSLELIKGDFWALQAIPIASMYGIFPYMYHKNQANVGKSTIHGSYGYLNKLLLPGQMDLSSFLLLILPPSFVALKKEMDNI